MESLTGKSSTFNSESVKTVLADGLFKYILYHNDKIMRKRVDHLSYSAEDPLKSIDQYPLSKFYSYDEKNAKPIDKKAPKQETKEHKTKFISISPIIKSWLVTLCGRLAHECDSAYDELNTAIQKIGCSAIDLDNVMFSKSYNMNIFKYVAKVVGQHEHLLKKRMSEAVGLEEPLSKKYYERYEQHYPTRRNNKTIADWLAKLTDEFFKVIACWISSKNWFDRDATLVEKNFAWVLWQLAENTEYDADLGKFIYEMRFEICKEKPPAPVIDFEIDMENLNENTKKIMETKKSRGKKAEPNKIVDQLGTSMQDNLVFSSQSVQPQMTLPPQYQQSLMGQGVVPQSLTLPLSF